MLSSTDTPPSTDGRRFDRISRINHWFTAAVFLVALGIGLVIDYAGLSEETIFALYDWHMLFGIVVLVYGLWRVSWRMVNGFPAPVDGTPRWQLRAARAVHIALLIVIIVMPISGIVMTISGGFDVAIWGVVLVPSIGEIAWLNSAAGFAHWAISMLILVLLALHIGGVLKHHFVDRDATLSRMLRGPREDI